MQELGSRSGLQGKFSELSEGVSEEVSRKLRDHLQTQSTNHDGFSTLDTLDSIDDNSHKPSELRDELNSAYDKLESFKIKEKHHVSKENVHKEKIRTLKDKVGSRNKVSIICYQIVIILMMLRHLIQGRPTSEAGVSLRRQLFKKP